jgi:hypothetical protein
MSDPGSTGTENSASSKKKVSPARNVVGIVVLVAVIIAGWFQYSAVFAYNRALKALDARNQDEEKGLLDVPEVENLVGKPADGPGSDFLEGTRTFTQTKYTWRGPLKSYSLTAYYTKGADPWLHHFEPDGTKYVTEPVVVPPPLEAVATAPAPQKSKGKMRRPRASGAGQSKTKTAAAGKASPPGPAAEAPKPAATADPAPVKPAEPVAEAAKPPPVTTSPIPAKQPE